MHILALMLASILLNESFIAVLDIKLLQVYSAVLYTSSYNNKKKSIYDEVLEA